MITLGRGRRVVRAAILVLLAGLAAGCSSSSSSTSSIAVPVDTAASSPAVSAATGTASASGAAASFVPIVEPFDPGHPARYRSAPATCGGQSSTVAIEQCYETRTENADAAIDAVQLSRFELASASERTVIQDGDAAWLSARQPVCAAAFHSGGTIDGIEAAACLLDESTARLASVQGTNVPVARLKSTDSPSSTDIAWYTTPEGSRIGMQATQGDESGGAFVAWTIIGGADGFVVNPQQFPFRDGSFTRPGTTQSPNPAGHRVAPGAVYVFSLDYKHLSADPNSAKGAGTYDYAPGGTPLAIWG